MLRVPAWGLLGPMLLLSVLHTIGLVAIDLPGWLLAAAYAVLGWYIGLSFRREVLLHAWRALPVVAGSALCLMALCAVLAWCLTRVAKVDALTAYLATSPGGLDSVAIIAASTPRVDLAFVLALQSVRLVFAIAFGPLIAGLLTEYVGWQTHLVFVVYLGCLAVATVATLLLPETIAARGRATFRVQRLSVPEEIRPTFLTASLSAFTAFALLGLFIALVPSFLGKELHEPATRWPASSSRCCSRSQPSRSFCCTSFRAAAPSSSAFRGFCWGSAC
jgi:membrane AbrB-like protein